MRQLQAAFLTVLWITGTMSTACASAQDNPPPPPAFGQEPPEPPRPPRRDGPDRKERIQRLENEIRELEAGLKSEEGSDERRAEWKKRLVGARHELKELLGDAPRQDDNPRLREKMARVEEEILKLERALQNKDAAPEDRKKWERQLEQAHANMKELRAAMRPQEKDKRQDPGAMDRLHARLREIDALLADQPVRPEKQKELMAEREKIQAELGRRGGPQGFGQPGMPPDPELHKLHMEAMELERASMDLAHKLRGVPKDQEADRSAVLGKLKEVVTKLFDAREKARVREIDLIKKRLEELNQMLEKRKENRDAIIEKRVKQLSGESDPLDW